MAGEIVHFEVPAADVDRAAAFWSGLFGLEIGPSMSEEFEYRMFQATPTQGGAIMASDKPGSGLVVYHDTANIDGSAGAVLTALAAVNAATVPGPPKFACV